VLPLRAYPVVSLSVGVPARDMPFELRWDTPGASFAGYVGGASLRATSRSQSANDNSELLRLGTSTLRVRLPLYAADAPTPVSRYSGQSCVARDRYGMGVAFASQGWLDMSDASALWTHWMSYSLSSERLVLGAFRPLPSWRAHELYVEGADYFNVTDATTQVGYQLRVDLNCDYSYVPARYYYNSSVAASVLCFHREYCLTLHDDTNAMRVNRLNDRDIVLGRYHAKQHFIVGRHLTRNALSLLPLAVLTPRVTEVDYLFFALLLLPILGVWYFGVYAGACVEMANMRAIALLARVNDTWRRSYSDKYGDRSLFHYRNHALLAALVDYTRLCVLVSVVCVVWGFRLDYRLSDLPRAYASTLVALLSLFALWRCTRSTRAGDTPQQTSTLALAMGDAVLTAVWLLFAVHMQRFVNMLIVAAAALLLTLRAGEQFLASPSWTRLYQWALMAWLFNGVTVPLLADTWVSTAPFKLEIALATLFMVSIFAPVYTRSRDTVVYANYATHLLASLFRARVKQQQQQKKAAVAAAAAAAAPPAPSVITAAPANSSTFSSSSSTKPSAATLLLLHGSATARMPPPRPLSHFNL
jgi:hypothetical protein